MRFFVFCVSLVFSSLVIGAQTVSVSITSTAGFPFHVVSSPAGIDCPGACEAKFRQSDAVILTAVADFPIEPPFRNYFFVDWEGHCVDDSETCSILGQGNFSVAAKLPEFDLINAFWGPSPVLRPGDSEWPVPRFNDPSVDDPGYPDGLVYDFLTGIRWMKNADCIKSSYAGLDQGYSVSNPNDPNGPDVYIDLPGDGAVDWDTASDFVASLNRAEYDACSLSFVDECINASDPNEASWSIPTKDELESLVDERFTRPMLSNRVSDLQASNGDPFYNVASGYYWSSTAVASESQPLTLSENAWVVSIDEGKLNAAATSAQSESDFNHLWLVCRRGGR